jgi:hypothetical protein
MTIKSELGGSQPIELDGMNWLSQPDPHVRVFDILENDTQERRWLSGILPPRAAVLDPLRTSLLECFPFSPRAIKPKAPNKRLWDRRFVDLSSNVSLVASASGGMPLFRSRGSVQGESSKSLVLEMTDVSVSVVDNLVLLDEHLATTAPVGVSMSFLEKLQAGRIYAVIAAYFAGSITLHDSAAIEAGAHGGHQNAAAGLQIEGSAEMARSRSVLFERKPGKDLAAFGIKVRQINFDAHKTQYFLGRKQIARIRGNDTQEDPANWASDIPESVLSLDQS